MNEQMLATAWPLLATTLGIVRASNANLCGSRFLAGTLLTFADKDKPAQGGLGVVVGAQDGKTAKFLVTSLDTFWQLLATQAPSGVMASMTSLMR